MPVVEQIAELFADFTWFLGSFDSSVAALQAAWNGFVEWLTNFWNQFVGLF